MARINQLAGYALSGLGIVGLAVSNIPLISPYIPLPSIITARLLAGFPLTVLDITSIILIIAGVFLLLTFGTGGKAKHITEEVPIYQGSKIVGYRKAK